MGFTSEQMKWCQNNEKQMWTHLVEEKLLFSSDPLNIRKLIEDAPHTTFYTPESPGRAAVWQGMQIVRAFADRHPKLTLHQLMSQRNYQEILRKSRYNPQSIQFFIALTINVSPNSISLENILLKTLLLISSTCCFLPVLWQTKQVDRYTSGRRSKKTQLIGLILLVFISDIVNPFVCSKYLISGKEIIPIWCSGDGLFSSNGELHL